MQLTSYLITVPKNSECLTSAFPLLTQAFHHAIAVSVVIPEAVDEKKKNQAKLMYRTSQSGNLRFEESGGRRGNKSSFQYTYHKKTGITVHLRRLIPSGSCRMWLASLCWEQADINHSYLKVPRDNALRHGSTCCSHMISQGESKLLNKQGLPCEEPYTHPCWLKLFVIFPLLLPTHALAC